MKHYSTPGLRILLTFVVISVAVFSTRAQILSGETGSHDPSRMILCNGKYYVYSTGGGMKYSADGVNWKNGPSPFTPTTPVDTTGAKRRVRGVSAPSVKAVVPEDQGIWAPDVIYYHNKYLLYYSVAAPNKLNHCAIGLLTSPTLDPASPDYHWTDAGVVLATWNLVLKKSAIDPGPFVDAKGNLWLTWGSGYANGATYTDPTIIVSKLDNATGLRSKTDTAFYTVAPGHIEASYIHYHDGFYYAFWNDGGCCSGVSSSYRIHVARAVSPTGPYLNKAGKESGDIFMVSIKEQDLHGPGHMGILSEPGLDRFSFHYYNAAGRPVLGVRTLVWGADGWPSVGDYLAPGIYKITADNGMALSVRANSAADGAPVNLQPYTGSDFQKWAVAITPEGYYTLTSVGSGKSFEAVVKATKAVIDQGTTATGNPQQWIIELTSDGKTYSLKSDVTLGVLTLPISKGRKPDILTTSTWSNSPAQKWIFVTP